MAKALKCGNGYVRFSSKPESYYTLQNELTEDICEARLYHRKQDVTKAIKAINKMRSKKYDPLDWPEPVAVDVVVKESD